MINLDEGLIVLSLFDGMACGRIALERAGIKVKAYYASEIDKPAMKVAKHNWPDIIHIGDVTKVFYAEGWLFTENSNFYVGKIDLLIGGSPCQGFSFAGKQLNFEDPRSKLFFEYVRLKEETECQYFFLENVVMKQDWQEVISKDLRTPPKLLNSALLSAQNRKRLYWTNIPYFKDPVDKGLFLKDILITDGTGIIKNRQEWFLRNEKSMCLDANYFKGVDNHGQRTMVYLTEAEVLRAREKYKGKVWKSGNRMGNMKFPDAINKKSKTVCSTVIKGARETIHIQDGDSIRMLYPEECEALMNVPQNYTAYVSDTQRYKMLGNGWECHTIAHLFEPLLYAI